MSPNRVQNRVKNSKTAAGEDDGWKLLVIQHLEDLNRRMSSMESKQDKIMEAINEMKDSRGARPRAGDIGILPPLSVLNSEAEFSANETELKRDENFHAEYVSCLCSMLLFHYIRS